MSLGQVEVMQMLVSIGEFLYNKNVSSRHYDNSSILNGFTFEVRNDLIDHEEGITIIGK